jgi:hypothetical protein
MMDRSDMSIETLIQRSGQQATITAEAPTGQVPPQDAAGGANRSDANWVAVASGVPCLLNIASSALKSFGSARSDARANVIDVRIYFYSDPVEPGGISTRHRVTVTAPGHGGQRVIGIYAVQGVTDPNSLGRIIQVDCERIRTP